MTFARLWAGKVYGTSTGNLFLKLEGADNALTGTLHHNEPEVAIVVYNVSGTFDGSLLAITGVPTTQVEGVILGSLKASGKLRSNGTLEGEWETDIGSAGTFILFPHARPDIAGSASEPEQLYTARHNFGPIAIDRDQITTLADDIQRNLPKARVVVTFVAGTEQSRFLEDFKNLPLRASTAEVLKLFGREPDQSNIDRSITVEFGPQINYAMAQGPSESWALGELEKLKREIKKFERVYAAKEIGIGINQLMLAGAVVFLPSLPDLMSRSILMFGVIALTFAVNWLHAKYLPHAAVYLNSRADSWGSRFLPSAASWLIGIAATVIATLLGAYLKGWLSLPVP